MKIIDPVKSRSVFGVICTYPIMNRKHLIKIRSTIKQKHYLSAYHLPGSALAGGGPFLSKDLESLFPGKTSNFTLKKGVQILQNQINEPKLFDYTFNAETPESDSVIPS